jgi:hypothetical protein
MTNFKWLNGVWLWSRNKLVSFLPNHVSNTTSSDKDELVRTGHCDSGIGSFDDVDQVPNEPTRSRPNVVDVVQHGLYIGIGIA